MEYFLERIARHLNENQSGDLRNQCLVFPNRRAGLYFLRYLSDQIDKPVWAPAVMTINEFFASFSRLRIPDNEILIVELYRVYKRLKESPESFDDFYFWGDMLLNDFDDLDKYMADASALFRNVQDLKKIDDQFGDLDEEQIRIIRRFWQNFEPDKPTGEKSGFISVWSLLSDLYSGFRNNLRAKSLAYEGMIFRDLADEIRLEREIIVRWDMVHFIGFNAINKCEEVLMYWLQKTRKGRFYWDYDGSYIKGGRLNSAGLFLRRNLKHLNNDMPDDWSYDTFLSAPASSTKWRIIETTSDISQVKLIPSILNRLPDLSPENNHHTAVILADENLLVPLLTSLPANIGDVNITMGYPLRQSDLYSLLKHILNLQRNILSENNILYFDFRDVTGILKHNLARHLLKEADKTIATIIRSNILKVPAALLESTDPSGTFFRKAENTSQLSDYLKRILMSLQPFGLMEGQPDDEKPAKKKITSEFVYRMLLTVNRLESIIADPEITLTTATYLRIFDSILRNQSVPFTGEPLSGIQIMGLLETRALDFRNIIMLSVNENILPRLSAGSSFIPYSIREAFGLPSVNHQESLYAYHFYRLLHRAENVTFIFNSNSDGLITGEMSRFLLQMKYEQIMKPDLLTMGFEIRTPLIIREIIERTNKHSELLFRQFIDEKGEAVLSPTAINTWLGCRMRFYYRYVNRLKESDKITAEVDHALFGKILHSAMRRLYDIHLRKMFTADTLNSLIKDEGKLTLIVNGALNETFGMDSSGPMSGNSIVAADILLLYLHKILKADSLIAPFIVIELEKSFIFGLRLRINGNDLHVRTGGIIDRVDQVSGITRIVDYKTGIISGRLNSIDDLFIDDRKKDADGWLQTLLYCEAYLYHNPGVQVKPSVYKVKQLPGGENSDALKIRGEGKIDLLINNYELVRLEFLRGLTTTVETIFSNREPFRMTRDENKCRYCPYKALCMR